MLAVRRSKFVSSVSPRFRELHFQSYERLACGDDRHDTAKTHYAWRPPQTDVPGLRSPLVNTNRLLLVGYY